MWPFKKKHRDFDGNCWTVILAPKDENANETDWFRMTIIGISGVYNVFDKVWDVLLNDSQVNNLDDYQIIIDSGIGIPPYAVEE